MEQIPLITHPLGQHWGQPDVSEITLEKGAARMSKNTLEKLHNYSASLPSAVYAGKMWRRVDKNGTWWLLWWSDSEKNYDKCVLRQVPIMVAAPLDKDEE